MKNSIILLTFLLGITSCHSKQKENSENIFYIINVLGAELFENPSLDSKILKRIEAGQQIIAKEILKTGQSKKIGVGLSLFGNFIKIQNESDIGFIFSSDLSKIKPTLKDVYKGIIVPNLLGVEKNKKVKKRIEKYNEKGFEIEEEITEFENATYTYTAFDVCFNHVYVYKNLTLSEVYHELTVYRLVINETENKIPRFVQKKENEYIFEGEGATQDLKIIENKDGTFTISSYDCT